MQPRLDKIARPARRSVSWAVCVYIVLLLLAGRGPAQSPVSGDTKGNTPEEANSILVQPYSEYGMLQKIRLSAAYLVNPTLAKQAEVEYFISDDKLRDANIESMANVQKRENVTAAFSNDGKYFKILGDHAQESTKGLDEWKRGFITDDKTLADKLNGEPVVTWGGVRRLNVEKDFGLQNPSSR